MYQHRNLHPEPYPQKTLKPSPIQRFQLLGNSAGLKLLASAVQTAPPIIQRVKLIIDEDGYWTDETGRIHEDIYIDFPGLSPGAVYDTDDESITLPDGRVFYKTDSDQEDEASEDDDPDYAEPERGYVLSPGTLKTRRYQYLSAKPRTTALPSKKDWSENYNPHHIIPNEVVRDDIKPDDVDPYNDAWNCIMLPNLSKVNAHAAFTYKGSSGNKHAEKPLHANHPNYNSRVSGHMQRKLKISDDSAEKLRKAQALALTIRTAIHRHTGTPQIKLDDMGF